MSKNILILLIGLIAGCVSRDNRSLSYYQDPFLDSFRDKGIKYILSYDPDDSLDVDSATLDSSGNIVRLRSFGLKERRSYDSLHFIKRVLQINDIPSNHFMRYYFDKDGFLVQEWNHIQHLRWSFNEADIDTVTRVIKFEIDKTGLIVNEIDKGANEYTQFVYNDDKNLVAKEVYSIVPKRLRYKWLFLYEKSHKLKRIDLDEGGRSVLSHYYTDGLLDSSVDNQNGSYTTKYKYVFY
ncbi:MAG TPA: hypothetical protein VIM75_02955 [Ohtaekwangia sp.]|uniref:hypothetical protein n=1 Tax=Ohtaekwangia sp. TaxID=2066019 RepID=UPI002F930638